MKFAKKVFKIIKNNATVKFMGIAGLTTLILGGVFMIAGAVQKDKAQQMKSAELEKFKNTQTYVDYVDEETTTLNNKLQINEITKEEYDVEVEKLGDEKVVEKVLQNSNDYLHQTSFEEAVEAEKAAQENFSGGVGLGILGAIAGVMAGGMAMVDYHEGMDDEDYYEM